MKEQSSLIASMEVGSLGVFHLKRLWSRVATHKGQVSERDRANEWVFDKIVIQGLWLALEETFQYLSQNAPTYSEFEQWVLQKNEGSIDKDRIERINSAIGETSYSYALQRALEEIERTEPQTGDNPILLERGSVDPGGRDHVNDFETLNQLSVGASGRAIA